MKAIQNLINHPATYLESAGKVDRAHLATVLQEGGEGSVLRLCLWQR